MADEGLGPAEFFRRLRGAHAPDRVVRARLGTALRELGNTATSTTADDATLDALAERVEVLVAELAPTLRGTRFPRDGGIGGPPGDDMFVTHPIVGSANPIAPPLVVERADATGVRGTANYGVAFEGLPGYVHGGMVAAAFDGVLIFAAVCAGHAAVTGGLSLRYRRPTPLLTDLVYEAEPDRVDGRKAFVTGRLLGPGGDVCVEAEGIFISVDRDRFLE